MVPSSHTPNSKRTVEEGMGSTVQGPASVAHAAVQLRAVGGAVIRVYRMRLPRGVEKIIAEKLREGSLATWDPIEEAEVEVYGGDLATAFGLSLGKLGPHLGY